MMKGRLDELKTVSALQELGVPTNTLLDSIIDKVNSNFRAPLKLYATQPAPDSKLNISSNQVETGDGSQLILPPMDGEQSLYPLTSLDFQTGAITGGTIKREGATFTMPGGSTIGRYRRAVFSYNSYSNFVNCIFSAESVTVGGLTPVKTLHETLGDTYIGHIDLEATAAAAYKTAGSGTSIIENKVGVNTRIFRAGSAGAGGGGSSAKTFTLANNQASAADVTGFFVNPSVKKGFVADVMIKRYHTTPDLELTANYTIRGFYKESTGVWHIGEGTYLGDDTGIVFTMTNAGQLQYTSSNISGTVNASYVKYSLRSL